MRDVKGQKIRLEGFNNLTKSLGFNIYDVCYAESLESKIAYLEYIDTMYNAEALKRIVTQVTNIIDATLLHVSTHDFEPRGASVTALIAEDETHAPSGRVRTPGRSVVGHLNKSHITAHTYPEYNPVGGIATFRVDIDIATCGMITPLSALDFLIHSFDSDVVLLDYRVRGFTRDSNGKKHYIDHELTSLQDYIPEVVLSNYVAQDINVARDNMFHTRMRKKDFEIHDYLFGPEVVAIQGRERQAVKESLAKEMQEIFECSGG